jgi:hypothetical protein
MAMTKKLRELVTEGLRVWDLREWMMKNKRTKVKKREDLIDLVMGSNRAEV